MKVYDIIVMQPKVYKKQPIVGSMLPVNVIKLPQEVRK